MTRTIKKARRKGLRKLQIKRNNLMIKNKLRFQNLNKKTTRLNKKSKNSHPKNNNKKSSIKKARRVKTKRISQTM